MCVYTDWRQNVKGCPEKMLSPGRSGENSFPARKGGVGTGYDRGRPENIETGFDTNNSPSPRPTKDACIL